MDEYYDVKMEYDLSKRYTKDGDIYEEPENTPRIQPTPVPVSNPTPELIRQSSPKPARIDSPSVDAPKIQPAGTSSAPNRFRRESMIEQADRMMPWMKSGIKEYEKEREAEKRKKGWSSVLFGKKE